MRVGAAEQSGWPTGRPSGRCAARATAAAAVAAQDQGPGAGLHEPEPRQVGVRRARAARCAGASDRGRAGEGHSPNTEMRSGSVKPAVDERICCRGAPVSLSSGSSRRTSAIARRWGRGLLPS